MEELNKLDELLHNEYDAMSFMNTPMPKDHKEAMMIIESKLTHEEFLKVEEMLAGSYVEAEKFGFEQGFMRGIVVMKGGAA